MRIQIEGATQVLYIDTSEIPVHNIEKARKTPDQEEGTVTFYFATGQSMSLKMPWPALAELREAMDRAWQQSEEMSAQDIEVIKY